MAAAATAYVITSEVEGKVVMGDIYKKCHTDADILFSLFNDEESAMKWIKSQIKAS